MQETDNGHCHRCTRDTESECRGITPERSRDQSDRLSNLLPDISGRQMFWILRLAKGFSQIQSTTSRDISCQKIFIVEVVFTEAREKPFLERLEPGDNKAGPLQCARCFALVCKENQLEGSFAGFVEKMVNIESEEEVPLVSFTCVLRAIIAPFFWSLKSRFEEVVRNVESMLMAPFFDGMLLRVVKFVQLFSKSFRICGCSGYWSSVGTLFITGLLLGRFRELQCIQNMLEGGIEMRTLGG